WPPPFQTCPSCVSGLRLLLFEQELVHDALSTTGTLSARQQARVFSGGRIISVGIADIELRLLFLQMALSSAARAACRVGKSCNSTRAINVCHADCLCA